MICLLQDGILFKLYVKAVNEEGRRPSIYSSERERSSEQCCGGGVEPGQEITRTFLLLLVPAALTRCSRTGHRYINLYLFHADISKKKKETMDLLHCT